MGKEDVLAQVNDEIEDMDLVDALDFVAKLIDELEIIKAGLEHDLQ
jgi:hypothetical protein